MNLAEDFFDFVKSPSKESFLKSQNYVIQHKKYDPYSSDLDKIIGFLDQNDFENALRFNTINLLLSPSAHFMKQYACTQKKDENAARSEHILAHQILECLLLTGDGSKEKPYLITQMSDQRDMLQFLKEEFESQRLLKTSSRSLDVIRTKSGKQVYFDVTNCLNAVKDMSFDSLMDRLGGDEAINSVKEEVKHEDGAKKKWWKIW